MLILYVVCHFDGQVRDFVPVFVSSVADEAKAWREKQEKPVDYPIANVTLPGFIELCMSFRLTKLKEVLERIEKRMDEEADTIRKVVQPERNLQAPRSGPDVG